jgi:tetratricopeptide (TPR) repeat protein
LLAPGDSPDARLSREGNQHAQKGEWKKALEAWNKSQTLEGIANSGIYFEQLGSYFRALLDYQTAFRSLGPPWDDYYRQVQWKLIYSAQYQQETPLLLQHRRDLVQPSGPDDYSRRIRQGNEEAARGRWYAARDIWLEAVRRYPANPQAFANLGIFFEINRDYDTALKAYARAAKSLGEPWLTYYQEVQKIKETTLKISNQKAHPLNPDAI